MTRVADHGEAPLTGSAGHPVSSKEAVAGCSGQQRGADQGVEESAAKSIGDDNLSSDESGPTMCTLMSPVCNVSIPPCHFYIDVLDVDKSTYQARKRHVPINPDFQSNLEEEQEAGDFSTFLTLLEIIPARKRKREQPLLDFSKSKILTSPVYSEGYERVMVQREATQTEAKSKATEREANKEIRRKEKEKRAEQVRICKEDSCKKELAGASEGGVPSAPRQQACRRQRRGGRRGHVDGR